MSSIQRSAPYDARQVANFLLDRAENAGVQLSVLKLLKLLYFSYGWYYVSTGRPLFHNPIEAWEHGPVVRAVWTEFGGRGDKVIETRATYLDLVSGERLIAPAVLDDGDATQIWHFAREYLDHTAWQLSELTHDPQSPWYRAYHSLDGTANLGMRISAGAIREYFTNSMSSPILS